MGRARYDQGGDNLEVLVGGVWTGAGHPGSGSTVAGAKCTLDAAASSTSVSGTDLTVNYRISFDAGFGGTHRIFLIAADASGRGSYWDDRGAVTVTS